ncbi:MAG: tetratricopeptide repeat protein [Xanthomonadales bacterium]|nr:tetratricopeptide repeat protein [Xanthomonadales bacterium]
MAGSKWWLVLLMLLSVGLMASQPVEAKRKEKEEPAASKTGRVDPKGAGLSSQKNQELMALVVEQIDNEEFDAALATLVELEAQKKVNDYERAKANQFRAQIASDRDDYDQAITYLESVVASDALTNAEHFQSMLILSQLNAQNDNFQKAIEWFDRWTLDAETIPGNYWAMQAQNYYNLDQYERAVEYIDKAFATGETPEVAWGQMKAGSLYELERYDDAAAFAREQKLAHVDNPDLRYQFLNLEVSAYLEKEDYDSARGVLEDAKANGWFDRKLQWTQLYQLYFEDEKPEMAAKVIEEGMAAGALDQSAENYVFLGEAYAVQEKGPEALAAFTKATELDPSNGQAEMQKGQTLLDMERPEQAKAALKSAIDKGGLKLEGNAWYLLCIAENDLDRVSAAIAACRKATEFPESKSNAQNTLRLMGVR